MSTLKDRIEDILGNCKIGHIDQIMDEIDKEQKILRPALRWFAGVCEEELRKNEYKKGWLDGGYSFYLRRAKSNLREIHIGGFEQDSGNAFIIKCCADCANFCMMLAHNLIEGAKNRMVIMEGKK